MSIRTFTYVICNTGFFLGGQCRWSNLLHVYVLNCWNLPCNLHVQHMSVQTNHISSTQQSHVTSDWTTGQLSLTSHTEMPDPWRQTSYAPLLCAALSRSVMFHSVRPHGLQPTRLLCPGIFQAGILEWVAMPSSRGSSQPSGRTCIS